MKFKNKSNHVNDSRSAKILLHMIEKKEKTSQTYVIKGTNSIYKAFFYAGSVLELFKSNILIQSKEQFFAIIHIF